MFYTKKNGFSLFSSGRFHHNDDGAVVHESSNGDRFIKVHDKIYLAEEESINNSYAHFSDSHEVTNTTPDADISITKNVFNMFLGAHDYASSFCWNHQTIQKPGAKRGLLNLSSPWSCL